MNSLREQFPGLYRLESAPFEPVPAGPPPFPKGPDAPGSNGFRAKYAGQPSFPYGADALGYLLYRSDGFVSLQMMAGHRPAFSQFDLLGGSPEENHAAFRTFVSFCGRYHLEGDVVWYDIEIASIPNFAGPRAHHSQVELQGDLLYLTSRPFVVGGILSRARFRWRRIAPA